MAFVPQAIDFKLTPLELKVLNIIRLTFKY